MTSQTPVVTEIVEQIAARIGVNPWDLDAPLYDSIDTDALEALFDRPRMASTHPFSVEFSYHGHLITVDGSREISIREKEPPTAGSD